MFPFFGRDSAQKRSEPDEVTAVRRWLAAPQARQTGRLTVEASKKLAGGCVGDVRLVKLSDGALYVIKVGPGLASEAFMLAWLAEHSQLPVPKLHFGDDGLILMQRMPGGDPLDGRAQIHAADLLASLHNIKGPHFGFSRDTVIGALPQPNPPSERWVPFFRDHRLLHMAAEAERAGQLPPSLMAGIEKLAGRLEIFLEEPAHPSLIHGDAWAGNILVRDGRVTAFIDPAIYFADPEIELAFGTLFSTFGDAFFRRYEERRPIAPGFWQMRKDIYNLYPLLVHVRLFGGGYVAQVEAIVKKFT